MGLNIDRIGPREWFIDVRTNRHGKEQRRRETFHGTQAQAESRYLEIRQELRHGKPIHNGQGLKTFGEVLALYREKSPPFGLPHEYRYGQLMRHLGAVPLPAFCDRLDALIKTLKTSPCRMGKPLADASINRLMQMVRAAFNLAVRMERLERNPVSRARCPKLREVPRDRVLTGTETQRLLEVVTKEAQHLLAIVRFALQVPCRKSELVRMEKPDLDLTHNAIRVRNGTTKNDEGCWKPIPPDMVAYFNAIPEGCSFLFYRVDRGVYRPLGDFKTAWLRCLRLADVRDFRFHDTRHISATNLLDNGTPEQVVMQVAGWKTNMLRIYYHRNGKKSLGLVRFGSGVGHIVDSVEVGEAKTA